MAVTHHEGEALSRGTGMNLLLKGKWLGFLRLFASRHHQPIEADRFVDTTGYCVVEESGKPGATFSTLIKASKG